MESATHSDLVKKLAKTVRDRHEAPGLVVLAEHHDYGPNRPWPIDGFVPDVLVSDLVTGFEAIGEAKTRGDLESERSIRQIAAFLRHLSLRPGSRFYLGVRWGHEARAQLVLSSILARTELTVTSEVLGLA